MDAAEIENEEQNDQQKQPKVLTAKVRKISGSLLNSVDLLFGFVNFFS